MSDKKYTSINREKAAGRVEFRSGKAVWQWAGEQGESTSILLKRLENPELELERTRRMAVAKKKLAAPSKAAGKPAARERPKPGSAEPLDFDTDDTSAGPGHSGFDPYNNG
ncbi:MAG TPA: hypothetical protein VGC50_09605 [Gammaproteobacteria bacterium]|jgi:hypothetical protein